MAHANDSTTRTPIIIQRRDWRRLPAYLKSIATGTPCVLTRTDGVSGFYPVQII